VGDDGMTSFTLTVLTVLTALTAATARPSGVCGYCGERGEMQSLARREGDDLVEEASVCVHCAKKDPLYLASAFFPQRRRRTVRRGRPKGDKGDRKQGEAA
jgi:hypothetical protein